MVGADGAALGLKQSCDQAEQGALATAVAAHEHPQARVGDLEAALVQRQSAVRPAVADRLDVELSCASVRTQRKIPVACCHLSPKLFHKAERRELH